MGSKLGRGFGQKTMDLSTSRGNSNEMQGFLPKWLIGVFPMIGAKLGLGFGQKSLDLWFM